MCSIIEEKLIDEAIESAIKSQEEKLANGGRTCLDEASIKLQEKLKEEELLLNDPGLYYNLFIG